MTPWSRVVLVGSAAVVGYALIASLATRAAGLPYGDAAPGSWLLYGACGYFAGRAVRARRMVAGASAGAILGVVDATVGWAVSWGLGPGRIPGLTPGVWLAVAVTVAVTSAALGSVGGLASRLVWGADAPAG